MVATTLPAALSIWVTVPSLMLGTSAQRPPSVTGRGVWPTLTCATIVQVGMCGAGCEHATIEAPATSASIRRGLTLVIPRWHCNNSNLKYLLHSVGFAVRHTDRLGTRTVSGFDQQPLE